MTVIRAVVLGLCCANAPALAADPLTGLKEIALRDADGGRVVIGKIDFRPDDSGATYSIAWNEAVFADHFLSMRPFKCVEGAAKHWCHVPYPYEIRRHVTESDLTDLEYDLLFIWKGATDYGINMWNGVYYRLTPEQDRIVGQLYEIDMDSLSAPPPTGELRPVHASDLHESDADSHWLPVVEIK